MPAAAVIRGLQALSGIIGRKELCRRYCKLQVKYFGSTENLLVTRDFAQMLSDLGQGRTLLDSFPSG